MATRSLRRVRRLLEADHPPSRNRNYDQFADPEGRRVWRLYRLYAGLLQELDRLSQCEGASLALEPVDGEYRLTLSDPNLSYHRTSRVPPELAGPFLRRLDRVAQDAPLEP